mmetsp:Transcript_11627/g.18908  ORF Transcript_11627/g.18908 Transcript_11627/m.18908 type:complete len:164 (+) Transcript_11627:137-628(+)
MLPFIKFFIGSPIAGRMKVSAGTDEEVISQLQEYGIQPDEIPVNIPGGTYELDIKKYGREKGGGKVTCVIKTSPHGSIVILKTENVTFNYYNHPLYLPTEYCPLTLYTLRILKIRQTNINSTSNISSSSWSEPKATLSPRYDTQTFNIVQCLAGHGTTPQCLA